MTTCMTHTTLSGAATRCITSGLFLGFLNVAGKAQPTPLLFLPFHLAD